MVPLSGKPTCTNTDSNRTATVFLSPSLEHDVWYMVLATHCHCCLMCRSRKNFAHRIIIPLLDTLHWCGLWTMSMWQEVTRNSQHEISQNSTKTCTVMAISLAITITIYRRVGVELLETGKEQGQGGRNWNWLFLYTSSTSMIGHLHKMCECESWK